MAKLVRLEDSRSGQRVAKDVLDAKGSLLFKSGTLLTPDLVEKLRRWKITHLYVEDEGTTRTLAALDKAGRAALIDQEMAHVFAEAKAHPVMARLMEAATKHLKERPE